LQNLQKVGLISLTSERFTSRNKV